LELVDPYFKFTVIDIRLYRRNSDEVMRAHLKLQEYLETHLSIPQDKQLPGISWIPPEVIVDDKAFPTNSYLMRPHPGSQHKENNEKSEFNYCLF
jgi:hypothetical protein